MSVPASPSLAGRLTRTEAFSTISASACFALWNGRSWVSVRFLPMISSIFRRSWRRCEKPARPARKHRSAGSRSAKLPAGYSVVVGGVIEESAKAQTSIFVVFPLMLFLMVTILMVQLKSFSRLVLVLLTAPLGIIGVVGALLLAQAPLGFVAILGVISLAGIVIRNSVILIAQIDQHILAGEPAWSAVISATQHRLRPILLTATAAILGMIPIAPTVFWGPMAYAVMGGLVVATLLTLVFLPALYVAWFRIQASQSAMPSLEAALESLKHDERPALALT